MTLPLNQVHLDNTARDLGKGCAAFVQRVQYDGNRRTEAPDDTDDHPRGEPTHAKNGTREEERKWDQNEHDNSLVGIKSFRIDIRPAGKDRIPGRLKTTQQNGRPW